TRTPNFVYFQGPQAQHQIFGVDGEIGYAIAPDGTPARASDAVAKDRLTDFYHNPIIAVRAALIPEAKLANRRTAGGHRTVPVRARTAPSIIGPPPAVVTVEEVAPGVWFLAGQSHHSVVVEFADHLTLIEAPQNDVRALAVIAKARTLRPDKPLTEVINTHHHFDHSGGLRAAVSEGLTIYTRRGNVAFYQTALTRPHT